MYQILFYSSTPTSPVTPHLTHSESRSFCGGLRDPASSVPSSSLVSSHPAHSSCLVSWLFLQHSPHAQVFGPTSASLWNVLPHYSLGFIPPPSSNIFSKPPGQMCKHLSQSTLLYYIFSINLTTFLHFFIVFIVCSQLEYKLLEDGNFVCFMHCCIPVAAIVPPQFIFTDWMGA